MDGPPVRDTHRHGIGCGEQTTIRIPDVGASRQHCRLDYDGRQVVLTDLNSANGTWSTAAGSRHPAPAGRRKAELVLDEAERAQLIR